MSAINHQWNGSILTVISDSGASSADLRGPRGETGPRGPQGPAGVIYDENGNLAIDLSPYAIKDQVDEMFETYTPDLTEYATKPYVVETVLNNRQDMSDYATRAEMKTEIAKAQLEGAGVDTSGFLTQEDLADIEFAVDGKTLITDGNGVIKTAIGGYANNGGGVDYELHNIEYAPPGSWNNYSKVPAGNIGKAFVEGCVYEITMTFKDGDKISFSTEFVYDETAKELIMDRDDLAALAATQTHISEFYVDRNSSTWVDGGFYYDYAGSGTTLQDKWILTDITIFAEGYVPIDVHYIPVDGTTIYINDENKLACAATIDGDNVNLANYYTKEEIDALIANLGNLGDYDSTEEVYY